MLTRATTDLRVYERALEDARGPDLRDRRPRLLVAPAGASISSPTCGRSPTRATRRRSTRCSPRRWSASRSMRWWCSAPPDARGPDPWWVLREPDGRLDELGQRDASGCDGSPTGLRPSGAAAARAGVEELIERALARTGYDLEMLALPGGERRLANVRKLMRLGREYEAPSGPTCAASSSWSRPQRRWGGAGRARERGAGRGRGARRRPADDDPPRQGPRVPDRLRRRPRPRADLARRAAAGRARRAVRPAAGASPGPAGASRRSTTTRSARSSSAAEEHEERRLFYVAMTRARERLDR